MGDGGQDTAPPPATVTRSSRPPAAVRASLQSWLAGKLPADAAPAITSLAGTDANGMSSETLLVDAEWSHGEERRSHRMVARLAPSPDDVPVFPSYDLGHQYAVIGAVGERTATPVPSLWWHEPDRAVIGTEFLVMERVDGDVPPDVMPYNFGDSWLYDATTHDQRRLQDNTVRVIADIHSFPDPATAFPFLAAEGESSLAARFATTRAWYEWMVEGSARSQVLDESFVVLEQRLPESDSDTTVLCWGDARIGNVIYRDFRPVAVLDWEMMALGPPELDLAWLAYAHRMFESLASFFGLSGMPGFLRLNDVAAEYEALTGHRCRHLRWYTAYSALQFGIVFLRIGQRAVHFGDREPPPYVDELIRNKDDLEQAVAELLDEEG